MKLASKIGSNQKKMIQVDLKWEVEGVFVLFIQISCNELGI